MKNKPTKADPHMHSTFPLRKREGRLAREVQARIGEQLRAMYDDIVQQGVPDRFAEMLRELDQKGDTEPQQ